MSGKQKAKPKIKISDDSAIFSFLNSDELFLSAYHFYNQILLKTEQKEIMMYQYIHRILEKAQEYIPNFDKRTVGVQVYGVYWAMMCDMRECGTSLIGFIQELPVHNDVAKK